MNNNSNGRRPLAEDQAPVTIVQDSHTPISDAERIICLECGLEIPYEADCCACRGISTPSRGSSWSPSGQLACGNQHESLPDGVEINTTLMLGSTPGMRCSGSEKSSRTGEVQIPKDEQHESAARLGSPSKTPKEEHQGRTETRESVVWSPETSGSTASEESSAPVSWEEPSAPVSWSPGAPGAPRARRSKQPSKGRVDINTRGRSITYRPFVANEIRRLSHQGAQARNTAIQSEKSKAKRSRLCSGSTACVAAVMLERLIWCCIKFKKEIYYCPFKEWARRVNDSVQTVRTALDALVLSGLVEKVICIPEGRNDGNVVLHLRPTLLGKKLVHEEKLHAAALKAARQQRRTERGDM